MALPLLVAIWALVAWTTLPSIGDLAQENPSTTALIEARADEAREAGRKPRRRQHWVSLGAVAPVAVQAVIAAEDSRFWQHEGFDTVELGIALAEAWETGELGRGASTITQQLAKNLWLSGDRSLWRKAKELVLARRLEKALPKKRILALYLNVVEWGPGVYGIEAAARTHFGVSAAALSPAQGAVLAAMLPAPLRWLPARKPPVLRRRALRIVGHLAAAGRVSEAQATMARAEIEELLGGGTAKKPSRHVPEETKPATEVPPEAPVQAEPPAATAPTADAPPPD